jgi:apolipoprotein N-acyltransferase
MILMGPMLGSFRKVAYFVILSTGWRVRVIAMISGAFGALSLAPFGFFPAIFVTLVAAVWLIDGAHDSASDASKLGLRLRFAWKAATAGWWLGFGYFLAGLWWLGAAFLVEADQFAWALPLGVIGLPAGLAFFFAFAFWLAGLFWTANYSRVLILAISLGAAEWLRGIVLTGFPWNSLGMAFGGNLLLSQAASIIGLYGLTFLVILAAASCAVLADAEHVELAPKRSRIASLWPLSVPFVIIAVLSGYGAVRLTLHPTAYASGTQLRIMQPNVAQDARFRSENKESILAHYLALSGRMKSANAPSYTHLIWPESAFPFIVSRDAEVLGRLGASLPEGAILLTGAARSDQLTEGRRRTTAYYNSVHAISREGTIIATYDKVHLVPFGEYLPFARLLENLGLRQFVKVPGGFTPGSNRQPMVVPGLPPMSPLVCYEAIFPGEVTATSRQVARPGLLLNVTNDAWFGNTPGPYQHFMQARLRTIEEGLPLVRASNSGISAIVDPVGRVTGSLPLGVADVLDGRLPMPVPATPYSRHPSIGPASLMTILAIWALFLSRRKRNMC